MPAAVDRLEFAPPQTAGLVRALALAVLAHAMLMAALTWGLKWKSDAPTVSAEAELWSALPQAAAPKLVEAPTPPTPVPAPAPPPVAPEQATPKAADPDIALEREKARLKMEKQLAAQKIERDKREKEKLALEQQRQQEEKLALEKKKQEAKRKEALKAQQDALTAQHEAEKLEAQRLKNIQRTAGQAGAKGAPDSAGSALQSSGPSATYAARVTAKVKPNIVFAKDPIGNPAAVVEVRTAPDGTIIESKLLKSSGNKDWDEAVVKAIKKTEVMPRDVDGRVPPLLEITFRPLD